MGGWEGGREGGRVEREKAILFSPLSRLPLPQPSQGKVLHTTTKCSSSQKSPNSETRDLTPGRCQQQKQSRKKVSSQSVIHFSNHIQSQDTLFLFSSPNSRLLVLQPWTCNGGTCWSGGTIGDSHLRNSFTFGLFLLRALSVRG